MTLQPLKISLLNSPHEIHCFKSKWSPEMSKSVKCNKNSKNFKIKRPRKTTFSSWKKKSIVSSKKSKCFEKSTQKSSRTPKPFKLETSSKSLSTLPKTSMSFIPSRHFSKKSISFEKIQLLLIKTWKISKPIRKKWLKSVKRLTNKDNIKHCKLKVNKMRLR